MAMEALITAILPSLCVSFIMLGFNRKQAKRDEKLRAKEEQRRASERCQLELLLATAKLSYALAMAAKRGTPNGEIEDGIAQYETAMNKFKAFERELVTEKSTTL